MNPGQLLQEHNRLCEELHAFVRDENHFLRQHHRVPDNTLRERKLALKAQLDESLLRLRELPAGAARDPSFRELLENTRHRILQILQLDRENEQLLLRSSLAIRRATPPAPASAMLQHIYGSR